MQSDCKCSEMLFSRATYCFNSTQILASIGGPVWRKIVYNSDLKL